jgi:hypothetical protein
MAALNCVRDIGRRSITVPQTKPHLTSFALYPNSCSFRVYLCRTAEACLEPEVKPSLSCRWRFSQTGEDEGPIPVEGLSTRQSDWGWVSIDDWLSMEIFVNHENP